MQRELQINLHRYGRYLPTEPLMLAVIQAYSARYGVVLGIAVFLILLAWGRHLREVGRTLRILARDERLVRG